MTPDSTKSNPSWYRTLRSLAVGLCVFYLGSLVATWLTSHHVHGFSALLDDLVGGLAAGFIVLVYEVRHQQVVDELCASEARERTRAKELETILDATPAVLIAQDVDCRRITGNRAAHEQLRGPPGGNFSLSAPSEERPAFRNVEDGAEIPPEVLPIQTAIATGKPVYARLMTMLFEDGTERYETVNAMPLLDEVGDIRGAVASSVDITALKQTEQALRDSEDKLRLLLDSTAEAILGIDLEHRCTFSNPASLRLLGYKRANEMLGKNMHDLMHHSRPDGTLLPIEECRIRRATETGRGVHVEDEVLWRSDGTSFPAEYWSYPQWKGGQIVGAVVAFVDITKRKLAEAAVADVNRKLIAAQEQERTRIGRELHDDINQRLALLALELEKRLEDNPSEVRNRVRELRIQTSDIANDVQALSHELHASKLEYLGVIRGMKSWCQEFGERR